MFYFLSAGIGLRLTGIEHAVLRRQKIFDALGFESKIVTVNHFSDYIYKLEEHHISQHSFLNLFDDYQNILFAKNKENTLEQYIKNITGEIRIDYVPDTLDCRVYVDHVFRFYIHTFENGQISYVNFFDNKRRKVKRSIYNPRGYLSQSIIVENNTTRIIQYHNIDGHIVIEEYYDDKDEMTMIQVVDHGQQQTFADKDAWTVYWFKQKLKQYPQVIMYSDKNKIYENVLTRLNADNLKKISVFHSLHTKTVAGLENGAINSNYQVSLENPDQFDGYIASTQAQKNDIHKRFGHDLNIWVIPPAFSQHTIFENSAQKTHYKIISVGRYYIEKRLDHIIQAIEILSKKYPDIELSLYGFGDSKDNYAYEKKIKQMVIDKHLEKNVLFQGYVHNIHEKLSESDVSVMTSTVEGFCIGILDSISVGTPVVAYNIKYGPAEILQDGKSGFLVEEGNIALLAASIEKAFLNQEMRKYALNRAEDFSINQLKDKWLKHILELSQ